MLVDALRPMWLPGLPANTGYSDQRFADWVRAGEFYFDAPVGPDGAVFILKSGTTLQPLFAAEVSRFSTAAIETAQQIKQDAGRPKSLAWLVIQSYYSAFFAAHALLRVTGISCSRFEGSECSRVD